MNETAALNWQTGFHRRINAKIRQLHQESEEIDVLKQIVTLIKSLRKQILTEKCD